MSFFIFSYISAITLKCVAACETGYFANGNKCEKCSKLCKKCEGSATFCTACFIEATKSGSNCIYGGTICPKKEWHDGSSCVPCFAGCKADCVGYGSGDCFVCEKGYFENNSFECVICPTSCKACSRLTRCTVNKY